MFHLNIRSLASHFEELQASLGLCKFPFDTIGISETKHIHGHNLTTNVSLEGYSLHSQPTKSSYGGVALYVNEKLDHFCRNDLGLSKKNLYETIWVEIKQKKSKNILCCCAYRHPDTDVEEFKDHLEKVFQKISKENKLIYLMRDFNFDLLNYETDTGTAGFVNSIVQFGFLPLIHQPTRITGRSATIIDNIFTNNFEHESISGNLLLKISDHLPQFSTIKKFHLDHKALNNYKHDYHKFDEYLFRDDFQIQDWSNLERSDQDSSQKFDDFTGDYLPVWKDMLH